MDLHATVCSIHFLPQFRTILPVDGELVHFVEEDNIIDDFYELDNP
jgi:hypothetical protein